MAVRRRKKRPIDINAVTNISRLTEVNSSSSTFSPILRWLDDHNIWQEVHLISDQYPCPPSCIPVNTPPDPSRYWFNHFPSMKPLLTEAATHLQGLLKTKISHSRRELTRNIKHLTVFFGWLLDQSNGPFSAFDVPTSHPEFPTSFREISLDNLVLFRNYLYEKHDPEQLSKGLDNGRIWSSGINVIFKYLLSDKERSKLLHQTVTLTSFPAFSRAEKTSTEPYSSLEMYMLITATDDDCTVFQHNWNIMRDIESISLKDSGYTLENLCWYIVNVLNEANSSEEKTELEKAFWNSTSRTFILTKEEFYATYSNDKIITLAEKGTIYRHYHYHYHYHYHDSILSKVNPQSQRKIAKELLRRWFEPLIKWRNVVIDGDIKPSDIDEYKKYLGVESYKSRIQYLTKLWPMAGLRFHTNYFQDCSPWGLRAIRTSALFVPDWSALYPFLLFVHATSGLNSEVINSLDRYNIYPDARPDIVCYQGIKYKTGKHSSRIEELSTPTVETEPHGIAYRIEFVKSITEPLLQYLPAQESRYALWIGAAKHIGKFGSLAARNKRHQDYGYHLSKRHQLVTFVYGPDGEPVDIKSMLSIDANRIRKTKSFALESEGATFQEMLDSLNDKSFNTLFKYYLNSDVQRRQTTRAVAAIQRTLMDEIHAYSRDEKFQGKFGDKQDNLGKENFITNTCTNRFDSSAPGQVKGQRCKASFRQCLGCKQSRVFNEHLPSIAFTIIQYEEAKSTTTPEQWDAAYGTLKARATDCLERYAERSELYASHISESWKIAKTKNGVFVPPLIG